MHPGGCMVQGDNCSDQSPLWQWGVGWGRALPGWDAVHSGIPTLPGQCHRQPGMGPTSWRSDAGLSSSRSYRTTPAEQKSASCCMWCSTPLEKISRWTNLQPGSDIVVYINTVILFLAKQMTHTSAFHVGVVIVCLPSWWWGRWRNCVFAPSVQRWPGRSVQRGLMWPRWESSGSLHIFQFLCHFLSQAERTIILRLSLCAWRIHLMVTFW